MSEKRSDRFNPMPIGPLAPPNLDEVSSLIGSIRWHLFSKDPAALRISERRTIEVLMLVLEDWEQMRQLIESFASDRTIFSDPLPEDNEDHNADLAWAIRDVDGFLTKVGMVQRDSEWVWEDPERS